MFISAVLVIPQIALRSSPDKLWYLYVPTNANKYAAKDKKKFLLEHYLFIIIPKWK